MLEANIIGNVCLAIVIVLVFGSWRPNIVDKVYCV